MQLRYELQIGSILKSMQDVVIPAIDPANRPAIEQSQLIMGMLSLIAKQLPIQFRFDRDELRRLIQTLAGLEAVCETDAGLHVLAAKQRNARIEAQEILRRCSVDPAELHEAVRALREQLGTLISQANAKAGEAAMRRIEQAILELSREQLLRDRALMAPQGWEPDPSALPSIQSLLET